MVVTNFLKRITQIKKYTSFRGDKVKLIENKTLLMRWIEKNEGVPIEELLHALYIEEEMSIRDISKRLNVHYHTINTWLKDMEIEMRLPHQKLLEMVEIKRKLEKMEGGKNV